MEKVNTSAIQAAHREMVAAHQGRPMKLTASNQEDCKEVKFLMDPNTCLAIDEVLVGIEELLNMKVSVPVLIRAALQAFAIRVGNVQDELANSLTVDTHLLATSKAFIVRTYLYKAAGQRMGGRNDRRQKVVK